MNDYVGRTGRWAAGLLSQPTLHHRRHQQRHQRRHHHSQHPHRDDHRHYWQRGRRITSVCNIISGMCAYTHAAPHNEQLGERIDTHKQRTIPGSAHGSHTLLRWRATHTHHRRRAAIKRDSGPSVCETRSETARCFHSRPLASRRRATDFCIVISVLWYLSHRSNVPRH